MATLSFELNEAEKKLIEAARLGEIADLSEAEPRTIRAEVVASLAANLNSDWPVHFHGLRLKSAQIEGKLDLTGAQLAQPLELLECQFNEPIALDDAEARTIRLRGSRVPGVMASRISIKGGLDLSSLHCSGSIRMRDARIEGTLAVDAAVFDNPGAISFDGARMSISGTLSANRIEGKGFQSRGEFRLVMAQLGGFDGEGAVFENPGGNAILADGLTIRTTLILRRIKAHGAVRLLYARIGTTLECDGAIFSNPGKPSLWADNLKTGSNVYLRPDFQSIGQVRFFEAEIGGVLNCHGASFDGRQSSVEPVVDPEVLAAPSGDLGEIAFHAEGAKILSGLVFAGAKVWGALDIPRVRTAALVLKDAVLENPGRVALQASWLVTEGFVDLQRLNVRGALRFMYSNIGGSFDAGKAKLEKGYAGAVLGLEEASTRGPILLRKEFFAKGVVDLRGAKVGGDLDLSSAQFEGEVVIARSKIAGDLLCVKSTLSGSRRAFAGPKMQVAGTFIWRELSPVPAGLVVLSNASVGRLIDDMESWPDNIRIDNFIYQSFEQGAPLASERLGWLRRQNKDEFSPQPYEQAVQVLRRMGHEKEARRIARAKQDDLRRWGKLGWPARIWNFFLGVTIGHGYQVWRALVILLAIIGIGALVFNAAHNGGFMTPVKPAGSTEPPAFEPLAYSIDVCLPILDLQQERYWLLLGRDNWGRFYRFYLWLHIGLGWLMTTLTITGLTGLVKKD